MRARALQMSTAAWLLFAAVLMAGTLGRTIRLPRVTWNESSSTAVVERAERPLRRVAVTPTSSVPRRSKAERAEKEKAAAMLILLMLGQNRLAAASR